MGHDRRSIALGSRGSIMHTTTHGKNEMQSPPNLANQYQIYSG